MNPRYFGAEPSPPPVPPPPSEVLKELSGKYDAADWRKALMDELLRVQAFRIMPLSTHDHLGFEVAVDIAEKFKGMGVPRTNRFGEPHCSKCGYVKREPEDITDNVCLCLKP